LKYAQLEIKLLSLNTTTKQWGVNNGYNLRISKSTSGRPSNHVPHGIYSVKVSKKLMIVGHWVNDYTRLRKYCNICCWLLRFEYRNT
jgi:hypothetical protein